MIRDIHDAETERLLDLYLERLALPTDRLRATTDRKTFERWLGRRVSSSLGGAYVFLPRPGDHAILINLPRIDRSKPRSLEVVVAEELVHMRDYLDGDRRRHAKHGHDRIALRVAELTGATLEEIRQALIPPRRRPARYLYACPTCRMTIRRRRRGCWSCARCAPHFDSRHQLELVGAIDDE